MALLPDPTVNIKNLESEVIRLRGRISLIEQATGEGGGLTPTGAIGMFGGGQAPEGWLFCDGAAVSREEYEDLFDTIGTSYGAGNGSTTFNLPDLRLRFPRGASANESAGAVANVNTHSHAVTVSVASGSHAHTHSFSSNFSGNTGNVGNHSHSTNTNATGSGNTLGPSANVNRGAGNLITPGSGHVHDRGNHNHTINEGGSGEHGHSFSGGVSGNTGNASSANHNHNSSGSADTISHVPAYTTVNYIIKT